MTIDELRRRLEGLPGDAEVTVRWDYRNAPVTQVLFDADHPGLVVSFDQGFTTAYPDPTGTDDDR